MERQRDRDTCVHPLGACKYTSPLHRREHRLAQHPVDLTYSGDDVTGFEYRRRTGDEGAWGNWTTVGGDETTRTYRNYPGSYSTRYCYQVRAVNDAGDGGASNISCATTRSAPPVQVVDPPGSVSLSVSAGDGQVTLNWTGGSGATSFYYSQDGGSYQYAGSGSARSRTITGLTNDTQYCFRVQARNSSPTTRTSDQVCVTPTADDDDDDPVDPVVPGTPSNLRITDGTGTSRACAWNAVSGATMYDWEAQVRLLVFNVWSSWTATGSGSTASTSASITGSSNVTFEVRWRVRARNSAGSSSYTGWVSD